MNPFYKRFPKWTFGILSALLIVSMTACATPPEVEQGGQDDPIVFADAGWDSLRFHNSVAQAIIENGYGLKTDVTPGSTPNTLTGLEQGDIDVYMEIWTGNVKDQWEKILESGNVERVSTNFDDNRQGFYVPTYMIKGDKKRADGSRPENGSGSDPLQGSLQGSGKPRKIPDYRFTDRMGS